MLRAKIKFNEITINERPEKYIIAEHYFTKLDAKASEKAITEMRKRIINTKLNLDSYLFHI